MVKQQPLHSFHIPVMGIAYTIDSPIRVAQYGISSVISLVDDMLMETLRELYSKKFELPFTPIFSGDKDARAKRITSYLNMVDDIVKRKVEDLKSLDSSKELNRLYEMLPDTSTIKKDLAKKIENGAAITREYWKRFKENFTQGLIDVNIMTKVDRENYQNGERLPDEYNDAHAALRGFALSRLSSSIVLSAGMNPKLYSYLSQFDDFFPNAQMELKKKVTLKVSDFRSALIQGKFLAKKGIWVSEYRIESGLNCGGHAFASDGLLLGVILQEFADKREMLTTSTFETYQNALAEKGKNAPKAPFAIKLSVQGGVGTHDEHQMLIDRFNIDTVGWGSPFLLVEEATSVDVETRQRLADAREDDLYLSNISPLGVMFNNLRNSSREVERDELIKQGKPGSYCPKKYLALNRDYNDQGLCTASIAFQKKKIEELNAKNLEELAYRKEYDKITEKSCLCIGLASSSYMEQGTANQRRDKGVTVCPGPNMAYFTKKVSLNEMVNHIYGRENVIERDDRPHMFIKELMLYIDYLRMKKKEVINPDDCKEIKYFDSFKENLKKGIAYYKDFFSDINMANKNNLKRLKNLEHIVETI